MISGSESIAAFDFFTSRGSTSSRRLSQRRITMLPTMTTIVPSASSSALDQSPAVVGDHHGAIGLLQIVATHATERGQQLAALVESWRAGERRQMALSAARLDVLGRQQRLFPRLAELRA